MAMPPARPGAACGNNNIGNDHGSYRRYNRSEQFAGPPHAPFIVSRAPEAARHSGDKTCRAPAVAARHRQNLPASRHGRRIEPYQMI
jgi:hypothetical protein